MKICQFNYANALINENYISRLLKSLNFFLSSKFDTTTKTNVFHQNEILHEKMALIAKSTINPKLKKTLQFFLMLKKLHYMVMNDSTFFMCKTLIVCKHTFIYIYTHTYCMNMFPKTRCYFQVVNRCRILQLQFNTCFGMQNLSF